MRILLLGSGGYIGVELCRTLLKNNYWVKAVDNFSKGHCDALVPFCTNENFQFEFGDVTNASYIRKTVQDSNIDAIILLASVVGAPAADRNPVLSKCVTVDGAKNVAKYKPTKIPLFFASTGSVYGALDEICTEDSPTNPQSFYGQHKLIAERILLGDAQNVWAYRFATAFGPSGSTRVNLLINDLTVQAVKNKVLVIFQADHKRTFIHIFDFCNSILLWLKNHQNFKHHLYNVGSENNNWTKREVAEKIKEKTGCLVIYEDIASDPDLRNYACNFDRIEAEGFKAVWSVEDGIDQMIKVAPLLQERNPYA